jgi:hypothetical protein
MKVARKSALKSIRLTLHHAVTPQWFQNAHTLLGVAHQETWRGEASPIFGERQTQIVPDFVGRSGEI